MFFLCKFKIHILYNNLTFRLEPIHQCMQIGGWPMLDFAEIIMCLKKGNTNIIIPIIVLIQKIYI